MMLALILPLACARTTIGPTADHGTAFEPIFQRFVSYATKYHRDIRANEDVEIEFGDVDGQTGDIAGQCQWNIFLGNKIILVKKTWDGLTDDTREALLFHELGHCVLQRNHVTGTVPASQAGDTTNPTMQIPESLMRPQFLDGATYTQYQNYYLSELFSQ
jgi:hypothetical protein